MNKKIKTETNEKTFTNGVKNHIDDKQSSIFDVPSNQQVILVQKEPEKVNDQYQIQENLIQERQQNKKNKRKHYQSYQGVKENIKNKKKRKNEKKNQKDQKQQEMQFESNQYFLQANLENQTFPGSETSRSVTDCNNRAQQLCEKNSPMKQNSEILINEIKQNLNNQEIYKEHHQERMQEKKRNFNNFNQMIQYSSNLRNEIEVEEVDNCSSDQQNIEKISNQNAIINSEKQFQEEDTEQTDQFENKQEIQKQNSIIQKNISKRDKDLYKLYNGSKDNNSFYSYFSNGPKESLFSFNRTQQNQHQEEKQDFLDSWKKGSQNNSLFANPFYEPNALNELIRDQNNEENEEQLSEENYNQRDYLPNEEEEEEPAWGNVDVTKCDPNEYSYKEGVFVLK